MDWIKEIFWTMGPVVLSIVILPVITILILRWIGAWMFRINDVIKLQKEILDELKRIKLKVDE